MQVVFSTGACALVLPALVLVYRTGSARWAAVLGVLAALAAVSGQMYLQLALLLVLASVGHSAPQQCRPARLAC